jgi:hypothetical protein
MPYRRLSGYLSSLPERLVRSLAGLAAGVAREAGDVLLPARVRRSRLYYSLIDSTLRFLIEKVGEIDDAYPPEATELPSGFLIRRTAGSVFEIAGLATFRASPVWVLAALADLAGVGRDLIGELAAALQQEGLLEPGEHFQTVDQLLDGLERTAGTLAETVNTPPLDVATLREEWTNLRAEAARIPLPEPSLLTGQWEELRAEAAAQERPVLELSAIMAISALRELPDNVRWLSRAARVCARRTGEVFAGGLLDHYRKSLAEIRETGYAAYWMREFRPYLRGALRQFSIRRPSATERFLLRRKD